MKKSILSSQVIHKMDTPFINRTTLKGYILNFAVLRATKVPF